ncbi:MAG: chemotaxis protein CheD [Candidatus Woesearchaeota archaeon]
MNEGEIPELIANIGQFVIEKKPYLLTCLGLGSCVGVTLYQDENNYAGMMHVMLPKSNADAAKSSNYFKYADVGIPLLLEELERRGCAKEKLKAKIAGGAHMFKNTAAQDIMDIGARNIEAVRDVLQNLNIKIISEDVAGTLGRTMKLDTQTGNVTIKTKDGTKII